MTRILSLSKGVGHCLGHLRTMGISRLGGARSAPRYTHARATLRRGSRRVLQIKLRMRDAYAQNWATIWTRIASIWRRRDARATGGGHKVACQGRIDPF